MVFNNINHIDEKPKAQAIARVPWRAAKKRRKTFLQSTQYYTTDIAQYEHINYTVQWLSSSIVLLYILAIKWVLKIANSVLFLTLNLLVLVLLGSGLLGSALHGTDLLSSGLLGYVLLGSGHLTPQLRSLFSAHFLDLLDLGIFFLDVSSYLDFLIQDFLGWIGTT